MKPKVIKPTNLTITRRNLPHWQIGASWYHVIFTSRSISLSIEGRDLLRDMILRLHGDKYDLAIAVIMPDHVHMLIRPRERKDSVYYSLSEILRSLKGSSSRKINQLMERSGPLWKDESFDRIIRDEPDWQEKYSYIFNNPVKAGLVERPEEYPWLMAGDNLVGRY